MAEENASAPHHAFNRREFLISTSLAIGTTNKIVRLFDQLLNTDCEEIINDESDWLEFFRPADLCSLGFKFINASINDSQIKPNKQDIPSYILIRISQQHIAEYYVKYENPQANVVGITKQSFVAGYSYLVFELTNSRMPITALLNWTDSNKHLSRVPIQERANTFSLHKNSLSNSKLPETLIVEKCEGDIKPYTTIEAPAGVFLSPVSDQELGFVRDNHLIGGPQSKEKPYFYQAELWQNDLIKKDSFLPPDWRLIDVEIDKDRDKDGEQVLDKTPRENLQKHFREWQSAEIPVVKTTSPAFRISGLGLTANLSYTAPTFTPENKELLKWIHEITQGRDKHVEVHTLGYLYPHGPRAVKIDIGERVTRYGVCYMEQKTYIARLDEVITLRSEQENEESNYVCNPIGANSTTELGKLKRSIPFKEIKVITQISPPIQVGEIVIPNKDEPHAFWPWLADKPNPLLEFEFIGIDWDGHEIPFKSPFIFIAGEFSKNITKEQEGTLRDNYQQKDKQSLRRIQTLGKPLAYYPQQDTNTKITILPTHFFELSASSFEEFRKIKAGLPSEADRVFYPQLDVASVELPIVSELMQRTEPTFIKYADAYRLAGAFNIAVETASEKDGIAALEKKKFKDTVNAERILFQIQKENNENGNYTDGTIDNIFNKTGQYLGGTVNPGMVIHAVSLIENKHFSLRNTVDTSGTIKHYVRPDWDPLSGKFTNQIRFIEKDPLKNTGQVIGQKLEGEKKKVSDELANMLKDIKIFGLSVVDIIDPNISLDALPQPSIIRNDKALTVTYKWEIGAANLVPNNPIPIFKDNDSKNNKFILKLGLTSISSLQQNSQETKVLSEIAIKHFGIDLFGLITVYFQEVAFSRSVTLTGNDTPRISSDTKVVISDVAFGGFLSVVQGLQRVLGQNNFLLDITPQGILLSQGVRIPPLSAGIFSLSNISLYTGVRLPFNGEPPSVRFSLSERNNPFTLAVGIFGGRGFFAIETTTVDGMPKISLLEASLEFGGYLGINLGVAQGEVFLMAGIYFLQRIDGLSIVEAYITCGGSLSILGIVSVSVTFRLSLTYQNGALVGRASVRVRISIFFFSASFTLTIEKRISGTESNLAGFLPGMHNDIDRWAYVPQQGHGPSAEGYQPDPFFEGILVQEEPYCMLIDGSDPTHKTPIYDPTIIHSHAVKSVPEAEKYCNFFGL